MTINWKYTDATNKIVTRTLASGMIESCFVSAISDWIAEGNIPLPADLPTPGQLWVAYQETAKEALIVGDKVANRCVKAGIAYPTDWRSRDIALRAIVTASSGDPTQPLPAQPPFPPGT
jgi:hypothetical protein